MKITISKIDAEYLIDILKKDHEDRNGFSVEECYEEGHCWYEKLIRKLNSPTKPKTK